MASVHSTPLLALLSLMAGYPGSPAHFATSEQPVPFVVRYTLSVALRSIPDQDSSEVVPARHLSALATFLSPALPLALHRHKPVARLAPVVPSSDVSTSAQLPASPCPSEYVQAKGLATARFSAAHASACGQSRTPPGHLPSCRLFHRAADEGPPLPVPTRLNAARSL